MKYVLNSLLAIVLITAATASLSKTVEITGQDTLRFSPETVTVQPGEQVTIKLVNTSRLPATVMSHNLIVLTQDANATRVNQAAQRAGRGHDYMPQNMDDAILAHTELIAGGESDTVTFTAPEQPGTHKYICTFPNHFASRMTGTLIVESK